MWRGQHGKGSCLWDKTLEAERSDFQLRLSARRNRGRHGLALAVFPARFPAPLALSFAAQHFQVSVYKVFLIDPSVNSPPAGHLQLTRRAGYLFR